MPAYLLWGAAGALGYFGLKATSDAADSAANFTKWGLLAGAGYAGFLAAKKAKLI